MSEYLKIVFQNLEPVRIADDSASQSGQTVTLRYIPGTAIRGVVVNAFAKENDFEKIKKSLFSSDVRYLNAYITDGEKELLPSPKGFYEDKTQPEGKKEIDNVVVRGEYSEGKKRAAIGKFCYIEGDCVHYYNVDTGSDLKVVVNPGEGEKQNVFRHEYICAGYTFTGYIAVNDNTLKSRIRDVFTGDFIIGNARSAGLGKCRAVSCEYTDRLPYGMYLPTDSQEKECYMMLLSNTAMRDQNGELCGLDKKKLEEKMGVEGLRIKYCATSTVDVRGYNRTWKTRIPSAVMYEQGSVFHLEYSGVLTKEKMYALCDRGIGIRLNEGFGRVLFLGGYENIRYKQAAQPCGRDGFAGRQGQENAQDRETLKIAAKCYYRNLLERKMNEYVITQDKKQKHPLLKGNIAASQLGILESFATAYKYSPQKAKREIEQYFSHALKKEEDQNVQKNKASRKELWQYVEGILDQKKKLEALLSVSTKQEESIMGIQKAELLTEDEELRLKLELLTKMIRYENKKEGA